MRSHSEEAKVPVEFGAAPIILLFIAGLPYSIQCLVEDTRRSGHSGNVITLRQSRSPVREAEIEPRDDIISKRTRGREFPRSIGAVVVRAGTPAPMRQGDGK